MKYIVNCDGTEVVAFETLKWDIKLDIDDEYVCDLRDRAKNGDSRAKEKLKEDETCWIGILKVNGEKFAAFRKKDAEIIRKEIVARMSNDTIDLGSICKNKGIKNKLDNSFDFMITEELYYV